MRNILLISNNDLVKNTPLGGNIDVDKLRVSVLTAQASRVESILGEGLYNKMEADFAEPITYTGLYLEMYNIYLLPFIIHQAAAEYIKTGGFTIANSGIYKIAPTGSAPVEARDLSYLENNQSLTAQMYYERLEKWLCRFGPGIPEYRCSADQIVNPKKQNMMDWDFC